MINLYGLEDSTSTIVLRMQVFEYMYDNPMHTQKAFLVTSYVHSYTWLNLNMLMLYLLHFVLNYLHLLSTQISPVFSTVQEGAIWSSWSIQYVTVYIHNSEYMPMYY